MEKRRKILIGLFIIIILLLVTLIIILAINNNIITSSNLASSALNSNIDESSNNSNTVVKTGDIQEGSAINTIDSYSNTNSTTALSESKEIVLTDAEKSNYNAEMNENNRIYLLFLQKYDTTNKTFNSGSFTDDEMLNYAFYYSAYFDTTNYEANIFVNNDENPEFPVIYIKTSYVKSMVSTIFGKTLNLSNIAKKTGGDYIGGYIMGGHGAWVAKFDKLVLNEKTGVYTLYFDNVKATTENLKSSTISYSNSDILNKFTLEFRKNGSENVLLTLKCFSSNIVLE